MKSNESKKYEEAIECFDKAIKLNTYDLDLYYNREIAINEFKQHIYEDDGKIIKRDEDGGEIIIKYSDDLDGYEKNANVLLFCLDKFQEAIEYFNKVIELNPNDSIVFNNKGLAFYYLQLYEDAIECFDDAIESNSKNTLAYYNKSMALFRLEKYQEYLFRAAAA